LLVCMNGVCDTAGNPDCVVPHDDVKCKYYATLYYDGLTAYGWTAWTDRQVEYCICCRNP
jgi:hypothetical protein